MNKQGLALFALILAILSFFNFLGIEKAVLAICAGLLALSQPAESKALAWIAVGIGLAYLAAVAAIFLFHLPNLTTLLGRM